MNKNSYKKLPPDIKTIFDTLVGEYKERYILTWNAVDFIGKEFGRKKGVTMPIRLTQVMVAFDSVLRIADRVEALTCRDF